MIPRIVSSPARRPAFCLCTLYCCIFCTCIFWLCIFSSRIFCVCVLRLGIFFSCVFCVWILGLCIFFSWIFCVWIMCVCILGLRIFFFPIFFFCIFCVCILGPWSFACTAFILFVSASIIFCYPLFHDPVGHIELCFHIYIQQFPDLWTSSLHLLCLCPIYLKISPYRNVILLILDIN